MATDPSSVPTQLIHTAGPVPVPTEYDVPGSQEIKLSSVSATFDGSGAGGAFECTLSLYSQSGNLLSRTVAGDAVAAGASGVASWYPFRRRVAASTGGGALTTMFKVVVPGSVVCPDSTLTLITWGTAYNLNGAFTTADNIHYLLKAGIWLIGYEIEMNFPFGFTTSGTTASGLYDGTNLLQVYQWWPLGITVGDANQTFGQTVQLDCGSGTVSLNLGVFNAEGADANVEGPGNQSNMWGVLLNA